MASFKPPLLFDSDDGGLISNVLLEQPIRERLPLRGCERRNKSSRFSGLDDPVRVTARGQIEAMATCPKLAA
jgi:hypothetical protein